MWQDGLALLIVVIALLALSRGVLPVGWFRLGILGGKRSIKTTPGGCGGCAAGASCAQQRIDFRPSVIQPGGQFHQSALRSK